MDRGSVTTTMIAVSFAAGNLSSYYQIESKDAASMITDSPTTGTTSVKGRMCGWSARDRALIRSGQFKA